jgi:hypothetical protein
LLVLNSMRCFGTLAFAFLAVAAGPAPAWAFGVLDSNRPTQHQSELRYADSRPQRYAMNYADEAAQRLGIREGQWEAFEPRSSNMPSLKGSMKSGRPMLILQWRPGK